MIHQNIKRERKLWGWLVKMLWIEGAYTQVLEIVYREVVQAVLIFGSDLQVLSAVMERMVEGTYTGFLQYITGKGAQRNPYGPWVTSVAGVVWGAVGMQLADTYIGRRQGTIA